MKKGRLIDTTEEIKRAPMMKLGKMIEDFLQTLDIQFYACLFPWLKTLHIKNCITNYPHKWVRQYIERGFIDIYAAVLYTRKNYAPATWDRLCNSPILSSEQNEVFELAAAGGLHCANQ